MEYVLDKYVLRCSKRAKVFAFFLLAFETNYLWFILSTLMCSRRNSKKRADELEFIVFPVDGENV